MYSPQRLIYFFPNFNEYLVVDWPSSLIYDYDGKIEHREMLRLRFKFASRLSNAASGSFKFKLQLTTSRVLYGNNVCESPHIFIFCLAEQLYAECNDWTSRSLMPIV